MLGVNHQYHDQVITDLTKLLVGGKRKTIDNGHHDANHHVEMRTLLQLSQFMFTETGK